MPAQPGRRLRPVLATLAALLTITSWEATDEVACKPDGDTQQMTACERDQYRRLDARLNAAYKRTMARLSPEDRDALRAQQREWVRLRDPQCRQAVSQSEGGSIHGMELLGCLGHETSKRTREIEVWHRP